MPLTAQNLPLQRLGNDQIFLPTLQLHAECPHPYSKGASALLTVTTIGLESGKDRFTLDVSQGQPTITRHEPPHPGELTSGKRFFNRLLVRRSDVGRRRRSLGKSPIGLWKLGLERRGRHLDGLAGKPGAHQSTLDVVTSGQHRRTLADVLQLTHA